MSSWNIVNDGMKVFDWTSADNVSNNPSINITTTIIVTKYYDYSYIHSTGHTAAP